MTEQKEPLIEVRDLLVEFDVRAGVVKAVDGLSLDIYRGKTMGLIGESGCGKSITARAILQMIPKPGKIKKGTISYYRQAKHQELNTTSKQIDVINITDLNPDGQEIRKIRGGEIGMIFQEPMSSLTPVYTAGTHIEEALSLHFLVKSKKIGDQMDEKIVEYRHVTRSEAREISIDMLRKVGIPKPNQRVDSYPHELSGGQRQRVMTAVALSCQPSLLIADEPTTALDVSIEAQILDLMRELQRTVSMSIMFITHNLGVIAEMAEEITVMYMGKQIERASTVDLFYDAKHPYTKALLRSIPKIGTRLERLAVIEGMVPDPFNLPQGCVFHPRCPSFIPGKCDRIAPTWKEVSQAHWARCLLYEAM